MSKRDFMILFPIVLIEAIVLNVVAEARNWSLDELFWPAAATMIVTGTLLWHVDWSRFRRHSKRLN